MLSGFVRIVTNHRVYRDPTRPEGGARCDACRAGRGAGSARACPLGPVRERLSRRRCPSERSPTPTSPPWPWSTAPPGSPRTAASPAFRALQWRQPLVSMLVTSQGDGPSCAREPAGKHLGCRHISSCAEVGHQHDRRSPASSAAEASTTTVAIDDLGVIVLRARSTPSAPETSPPARLSASASLSHSSSVGILQEQPAAAESHLSHPPSASRLVAPPVQWRLGPWRHLAHHPPELRPCKPPTSPENAKSDRSLVCSAAVAGFIASQKATPRTNT